MPIPTDPAIYKQITEKVKARVARWPSAYASGMVVNLYKKYMEKIGKTPYIDEKPDPKKGLARWYNEDWIDIKTGKPCGAVKTKDYYPTCRPAKRVTAKSPVTANELSATQKKQMVTQKQVAKENTIIYKQTKNVKAKQAKQNNANKKQNKTLNNNR